MLELQESAAPARARHVFASQAHAAAHEVITLRELLARARCEGLATEGLRGLVLGMIAERGRFLAAAGADVASDLIELAGEERRRA
jgi:hypothetical protein